MAVMIFAVRPALLAQLQGAQRLGLMVAVLKRFYAGVSVSVLLILATGLHLYGAGTSAAVQARKAIVAAGGSASGTLLPLGWHVMLGLGVAMMLIYGHIYFAGFRKLQRAHDAGDLPGAAHAAEGMHKMVVLNFALGVIAVAAVKLLK